MALGNSAVVCILNNIYIPHQTNVLYMKVQCVCCQGAVDSVQYVRGYGPSTASVALLKIWETVQGILTLTNSSRKSRL